MNKILLITQREFTSRVRKKSFIIMSILAPLLFGGFISLMAYFGGSKDEKIKNIAVIDSSSLFLNKIPDTQSLKFEYLINVKLETLKKDLKKSKYYGVLYINPNEKDSLKQVQFYSYSQPGISVVQHITNAIENEIRDKKLKSYHIENIDQILKSVETKIDLQTIKLSESGEEKDSSTFASMGLAYVGSLLIYMFILLYGVQVMRGVIEEKTNRIVEVIISSVRPFQLMMGKVLGVALTAITQFLIWVVLSLTIFIVAKQIFLHDVNPANMGATAQTISQMQQSPQSNAELTKVFSMIESVNYLKILGLFIFYFITGYLLYSSLFAAVGAAVDNEADTQQFVMPITIPLIAGIMIMVQAFQFPDSPIAIWGSIIPLTAPIVMMARIPYEVPWQQLILSMSLMVITFVCTIWLAAKIYRTGILMYGKKVTFKEIFKWLKY
jgi:ABC-2 type transport system permease protein